MFQIQSSCFSPEKTTNQQGMLRTIKNRCLTPITLALARHNTLKQRKNQLKSACNVHPSGRCVPFYIVTNSSSPVCLNCSTMMFRVLIWILIVGLRTTNAEENFNAVSPVYVRFIEKATDFRRTFKEKYIGPI
jgi:hypothetical protein